MIILGVDMVRVSVVWVGLQIVGDYRLLACCEGGYECDPIVFKKKNMVIVNRRSKVDSRDSLPSYILELQKKKKKKKRKKSTVGFMCPRSSQFLSSSLLCFVWYDDSDEDDDSVTMAVTVTVHSGVIAKSDDRRRPGGRESQVMITITLQLLSNDLKLD